MFDNLKDRFTQTKSAISGFTEKINDSNFMKSFNKIHLLGKVSLFLAILLLISIFAFNRKVEEGFTHATEYMFKDGPEMYDNFYASIYDSLVFNNVKNDYEIGTIIKNTEPTEESIILDIGSGTGHHVGKLNNKGYNAYGLEISKSMISEAKNNYPECNFVHGDALDNMVIPNESVTHILCLNFTIYDIKDKQTFFHNCMDWLMSGGTLALHLVNRDRFDPTKNNARQKDFFEIPRNPHEQRPTQIRSKFDKYDYKGNFELSPSNNRAEYKEVFIDNKTGKVRQNSHMYFMEPQKQILNMALNAGFISHAQINLSDVDYDYQFIYILQKPN